MTKFVFSPRFLCVALAVLIAGCHSPASKPAAGTRVYPAHGIIEHISADRHLVTIHHQAIPGYMMEMTMDFPVHDEHLMDGLVAGDRIDFTLMVTQDDAWVGSLRRTGHTNLATAGHGPAQNTALSGPKPGDLLPDAELIAENGRPVNLSDFRGKVVVFTFFFTRCPLPNYCPLMNRNFGRTRTLLLSQPGAPKNWQFISISFDPDFDKPTVLTSYASFYRNHNNDRWLFASATPATLAQLGAPLGLIIMRQGNNISHNLRTVVVDPQGRLFRQFNNNLWTPAQLAQTVVEAAKAASTK
jgi:protein SCO1/2